MKPAPGRLPRTPILVVLALAAFAVAGTLWLRPRNPAASMTPAAIPVIGAAAESRDVPLYLQEVGSVASLNVTPVRARVDGQVVKIAFVEGEDVKAGQLLAVIDPRPYQAALLHAEAIVRKDQAQVGDLQLNVRRADRLAAMGAGPHQNADTLAAQVQAAEATLQADTATADSARLDLGFTSVVSPLDGRAGLRQIDAGSIVHVADPTPIVTVTQMKPISVLFSIPQHNLDDVREQQHLAPLEVRVREADDRPSVAGEVTAIDSAIDPATGEVRLRATFGNDDLKLWPGELVTVRLQVKTLHHATTIPDRAVLNGQNGAYVWRIRPDSTVEVRLVHVAATQGGTSVIDRGLAPGERVVAQGQSRLSTGAAVAELREPPG